MRTLISGKMTTEDRVSTLLALYEVTREDSLDLAISYLKQALGKENKLTSPELMASLYAAAGDGYYTIRKLDSSLILFQKALPLHTSLGDEVSISQDYMDIGLCHYSRNEYSKAMEYYLLAEPLVQKEQNEAKLVDLYNRLSFILIQQEQLDQALTYLTTNYKKLRRGPITPEAIKTAFNISNCLKRSKKFELALNYADSTELFSKELGFEFGRAKALGMKAYILMDLKRHDDALIAIMEAEKIYMKSNSTVDLFQNEIAKCRVYQERGDFQSMLKSVEEAQSKLGDIEDQELLLELYDVEYVANKNNEHYKAALDAHERFSAIQDSIFKMTNAEKINELLTKYEAEKKDSEIQNLSQQSQIQALEITQRTNQLIGITIGAILMVLIGLVLVQQRRLKYKQQAADLEQRMLRLQMNPHFIFNALGSIQSYILENQTSQSVSYLAQFAKLMRQILEHSREEFISVEQEAEMLTNYLAIQQLRFANRFTYSVEISPDIDPSEDRIPPLFAQPLVENALEHGFKDIKSGGQLTIRFQKKDGHVELIISDNGKGIAVETASEGHKSLATVITRDRLSLLSKKMKGRYYLDLVNAPEGGTIAKLTLPLAE